MNPTRLALFVGSVLTGLLFFWPFLQPGKAFLAVHTDALGGWRGSASEEQSTRATQQANPLMTDTLWMFHPEVVLNRDSLRSGSLPTWNPYAVGGLPHIASGTPATFYPFGLLSLGLEPPRHYAFAAFLQAVVAMATTIAFLRQIGLHPLASAFGGVLFAYSGWMTAHMFYYQISGASVWLPTMLLGVEWIVTSRKRSGMVLLALGVGFSLLAGFPQISLISLLIAGLYATFKIGGVLRSEKAQAIKPALMMGLGVGLGLGIAGVQLIASGAFTFSDYTNRPLVSYELLQSLALEPQALATAWFPDLFGHPDWEKTLTSSSWRRSLLSGIYLSDASNYMETQLYLGLLPWLLIPFAFERLRRPLALFAVLLILGGVLAAIGTPLLRLISSLPGFTVGVPGRFLYASHFGIILLAAIGLHSVIEGRSLRSLKLAILGGGALGALAMFGSLSLEDADPTSFRSEMAARFAEGKTGQAFNADQEAVENFIPQDDFEANRFLLRDCLSRSAIGWALAAMMLLGFMGKKRGRAALLVLAITVLDLTAQGRDVGLPPPLAFLGRGFMTPIETEGFYRSTPITDALQRHPADDPFRVIRYGSDDMYNTKTLQCLGIEDAQGYCPLYLRRYELFQDALEPGLNHEIDRTETTAVRCLSDIESLSEEAFRLLGARYVMTRSPIDSPDFEFVTKDDDGVFLYFHLRAFPRAFVVPNAESRSLQDVLEAIESNTINPESVVLLDDEGETPSAQTLKSYPKGPSKILWEDRQPNEIQMRVESLGGWLVLTDGYKPDWRCEVDGEETPVFPAFAAFRAIELPPGEHEIRFVHSAPAEHAGFAVSVVCLLVALVIPWLGRMRKPESMNED